MPYNCGRCCKSFNHKGKYEKHINRKYPCIALEKLQELGLKCAFCSKAFTFTRNYNRHIKACSKNPDNISICINDDDIISDDSDDDVISDSDDDIISDDSDENTNIFSCEYCKRNFSRQYSVIRHHRICKAKQIFNENAINAINAEKAAIEAEKAAIEAEKAAIEAEKTLYKLKLDEAHKEIDMLKKAYNELKISIPTTTDNSKSSNKVATNVKTNTNSNNTTKENNKNSHNNTNKNSHNKATITNSNNNTNIQNNYNINLCSYGKEDLSFINNEKVMELLKKGDKAVESLVEYIHCNKDKPEFQNIYVSDKNNVLVFIYKDGKWRNRHINEIYEEIANDKNDFFQDKFDIMSPNLSEADRINGQKIIDKNKEVDQMDYHCNIAIPKILEKNAEMLRKTYKKTSHQLKEKNKQIDEKNKQLK